MSENAEQRTSTQLTLFAEDFLANLTPSPGSERARKMTEISGRNIAGLYKNCDLESCLVRTFLESSVPYSTTCYLTWKIFTTPSNRLLFQLVPSMPRTVGIASGLLPTPTAMNVEHPNMELTGNYRRLDSKGNSHSLMLADYARLLPTDEATELVESGDTGKLNPGYVEWMMSFPIGWTDLER